MCDRPVTSESITLTDCLSCAGCVSITDESESEYKAAIEMIKNGSVNIIITPQAKVSLFVTHSAKKNKTFREFEYALVKYLAKYKNIVIDSTVGSKLLLQKEIDLVSRSALEGDKSAPIISTICPGTVLYLVNTLGADIKLSNNLSPVELSSKYVNAIYNANPNVSIVMCKDKRIEAKKNSYIKYAITTKEFYDHFLKEAWEDKNDLEAQNESKQNNEEYSEFERKYSVARILDGSTSGGVFEGVLAYLLKAENTSDSPEVIKKIPKHIEFLLPKENKKVLQLFGSSRIISFISKVKKNPSVLLEYLYIEMNMCIGGCLFGPSQSSVVNSQLYMEIMQDSLSQEAVQVDPSMIKETRAFGCYKKSKEKRNYLVEW
ncbi:hypothetical protein NERG_00872 [Nematocida ausubeli]|uniref:Iron hydrogenase large subunit C-terminal domain-containing protein n=1 Tax=Nematocida ausubeli (strain ATCC PRA-371 / ERTm2) TaxID=1913371 RepID=H8ZBC3_NEMA1|nr:hypothetical protein NERG_00872 [Nematocida ausubeli]